MAESRAAEPQDLSNLSQQDIEDIEAGWTVPYEAQANRWEEPLEYESTELTQTQNERLNRLERDFNDKLLIDFHKSLLENYGYYLLEQIYAGKEEWDHQVWKVRKFVWDEEGVVYAVKIVSLFYYRKRFVQIERMIENMLKESNLLLELNHKNVIKVYDVIGLREHRLPFPTYVCSIMELMDGSLRDYLQREVSQDQYEPEAKIWFRQIAQGLNYLHNEIEGDIRVSHLALTSGNILYKCGPNEEIVFKIVDFEECLVYESDEPDVYPYNNLRWNRFSPPERGHPYNQQTRPMDVFSLGLLLALGLIRKRKHWKEFRHYAKDMKGVERFWAKFAEYSDRISTEGRDLLKQMTLLYPENRATIEEVLQHNWLNSHKRQRTD